MRAIASTLGSVALSAYALVLLLSLGSVVLFVLLFVPIAYESTYYRATIRVDGHQYSSDAVLTHYGGLMDGLSRSGRVFTFRLPDGRVIVMNVLRTAQLECLPYKGREQRRCSPRSKRAATDDRPDGYVFDNGEHPRQVSAFQAGIGNPRFGVDGGVPVGSHDQRIPVSELNINLESVTASANYWRSSRDYLDRDFPGYDRVWYLDGERGPSRLNAAAFALNLPSNDGR